MGSSMETHQHSEDGDNERKGKEKSSTKKSRLYFSGFIYNKQHKEKQRVNNAESESQKLHNTSKHGLISGFDYEQYKLTLWNSYEDAEVARPLPPLPIDRIPARRKLEQNVNPKEFAKNQSDYKKYIGGDYLTRPTKKERLMLIDKDLKRAKDYIEINLHYLADEVKEKYERFSSSAKIYREGTKGEYSIGGEKTSINKYKSELGYKIVTEKLMGVAEQLKQYLHYHDNQWNDNLYQEELQIKQDYKQIIENPQLKKYDLSPMANERNELLNSIKSLRDTFGVNERKNAWKKYLDQKDALEYYSILHFVKWEKRLNQEKEEIQQDYEWIAKPLIPTNEERAGLKSSSQVC